MSKLRTILISALSLAMPGIALASSSSSASGSASNGSYGSYESYSESAAGVPELDGSMLMLTVVLTLVVVAIVRERYLARLEQ